MKKLFVFLSAMTIVACQEEPKDYASFSGKITNSHTDSILVRSQTYSKTIMVDDEGKFEDTLKLSEPGIYGYYDGERAIPVFLKNGFDIHITADGNEFDKTIEFSGNGAEHNNFLVDQKQLQEELLDPEKLSSLSSQELEEELASVRTKLAAFYNENDNIDTLLVDIANRNLDPMLNMYQNYFLETIASREQFPAGSPSPTFENYENYEGGTTSLKDLEGKYVYMDIWATWCAPCIAEIPSLKRLAEDYKDKNIHFVSISIDDAQRSGGGDIAVAKDKWKTMVEEKELAGIQLFSNNNWQSDFIREYNIQGIPRFILIDPDGNIVDANAPRPSSDKLVELFDSLNL